MMWAAVLVAALLGSSPGLALAHGALKKSLPANGAHLTSAPRELRLTFTEAPELAFTRIELIGPDGNPVSLDPLRAVNDSTQVIVAQITGPLAAGVYTVRWQIAGKDGHPVRDRFTFTIAPGAVGLGVAQDSARRAAGAGVTAPGQPHAPQAHNDPVTIPSSETAFDAESALYVVVRWLTFAGILIVLGAVAFHYFVLGFLRRKQNPDSPMLAPASARAAAIGLWAAAALVVVTFLRLYAQSYALHGNERALNGELIATMLSRTVWGWGWLLQLGAVLVGAFAFRAVRRGRGAGWRMALLAAIVLAFTPALSGHAASVPRLTWVAVLSDAGHVTGASGWVGSLLLVLAAGIPAAWRLPEGERGPAVAELVNAFSPTALVFAGITATTGVFAAWLHVGTVDGLWGSGYGRTLLLKLGLLSIVALTGAYNWLRVKPTLGDTAAARRIRRSGAVELAVAVVVLAVTAVLVATPPGVDEKAGMARAEAMSSGGRASTLDHSLGSTR